MSVELSWIFICAFHFKMIYFGFVCWGVIFFLVLKTQNKCLVFSGCLQRVKMLEGSLSACCGLWCREMLRNALQSCLLWLQGVRSCLEYLLDLGLLLLLCSLVLSEAFLVQTFCWCLPHSEMIRNSAQLQVKSNSINLLYFTREQRVNLSILTYSTSVMQHYQWANIKICSALLFLVHRTLSMTLLGQQLFISLSGAGRTGGFCWFTTAVWSRPQQHFFCLRAHVREVGIEGRGDYSHLLSICAEMEYFLTTPVTIWIRFILAVRFSIYCFMQKTYCSAFLNQVEGVI